MLLPVPAETSAHTPSSRPRPHSGGSTASQKLRELAAQSRSAGALVGVVFECFWLVAPVGKALVAILLIASSLVIYISHIKIDDVENSEYILFSKSWAPFQQMSNMSPLGYYAFDIVDTLTTTNKTQLNQNKVSKEDIESIDNWLENNKENLPDNSYKGIYKGNNVIYIQVESLENWVINTKINGQEITPNLNKLLNNSIYFNNI